LRQILYLHGKGGEGGGTSRIAIWRTLFSGFWKIVQCRRKRGAFFSETSLSARAWCVWGFFVFVFWSLSLSFRGALFSGYWVALSFPPPSFFFVECAYAFFSFFALPMWQTPVSRANLREKTFFRFLVQLLLLLLLQRKRPIDPFLSGLWEFIDVGLVGSTLHAVR